MLIILISFLLSRFLFFFFFHCKILAQFITSPGYEPGVRCDLLKLVRLPLYLVLQVQIRPQALAESSELRPQPAQVLHLVPCPKYSVSNFSELPGHLPRAIVSSD